MQQQQNTKQQQVDEQVEQARQNGYVLATAETPRQVHDVYRHWCEQECRPAISVKTQGTYATLTVDMRTAIKGWESAGMLQRGDAWPALAPDIAECLHQWTARYLHHSPAQSGSASTDCQELVLKDMQIEDVDQAVREFLHLWARFESAYQVLLKAQHQTVHPEAQALQRAQISWKSALARTPAQDTPSCEHVAIPERLPALLTKEQICTFLGLPARTAGLKTVLVAQLTVALENDAETKARFFEVFAEEIAIEPWELEKLLDCTPTERKRWVSDGKLVPLATRSVRKSGKELVYPIFDRRDVAQMTPQTLVRLREEHASLIAMRRQTGARNARESRIKYAEARKLALARVEEACEEGVRLDSPELTAVLRLAFWTQMASRWAKENMAKSRRATKQSALYRQRMEAWYQRKNEALQVLAHSPYARLSYYRPEDADKIDMEFCADHYEIFREGYYEGKWDFYACHKAALHACPACRISVTQEYYALYVIEISAPTSPVSTFSFHIPQPIGKAFLPPARTLPQVSHVEQEGLFRFGRGLYAEEKMLYREKDVEAHFAQALAEASIRPGMI
ncbi:MAG TPA: hypothetical protein VGF67_33690 [Ktedonobacteraceae bacterium]